VCDPVAPARFTKELVTGLSLVFFLNGIILDEDLKLSAGCQVYVPPFLVRCSLHPLPPLLVSWACVKLYTECGVTFNLRFKRDSHMALCLLC